MMMMVIVMNDDETLMIWKIMMRRGGYDDDDVIDDNVEDGDNYSKLDEDTQLALAISSSLQADLTEAGPSTTGNSAAPNRRGRKNKQYESDCRVK